MIKVITHSCACAGCSSFAKRPEEKARQGRSCEVLVNYYTVKIGADKILHYNVEIDPLPTKQKSLAKAIYNKIVRGTNFVPRVHFFFVFSCLVAYFHFSIPQN